MQREYVLLAGVDPEYAAALHRLGERLGLDFVIASEDGGAASRERPPTLTVIEIDGRRDDPGERLRRFVKPRARVPTVVLARRLETDTIVRLVRDGVAEVIGIPAEPTEVAARALGPIDAERHTGRGSLVGLTPAMRALRTEIEAAARTGSTVLITGETGTGKGLIARTIHELSKRKGALVHIDCAALTTTIIESELFGHERGAFTGAVARRIGRFEQAYDGTVFLDEIAELDPPLQAKLLRILQDRCFERIGGTQTLHMNARVIAATNRDLRREMIENRFRKDLYYRLSVIELEVPALRERLDDLPLLVQAGLEEIAGRLDRAVPHVTPGFLDELALHDWPGNVRELMNLVERVLVRGEARSLDAADLERGWRTEALADEDADFDDTSEPALRPEPLLPEEDREERLRIVDTLRATAGNVSRSARLLGISRSRLRYRIVKYDLMHLIPDD
ncbi:MAG: sigma-54-dependent Fis family transcriptional regulator [Deltaproteobacteria bacterium]|nr:sigma-54-dependent Fis family transcriptional regulator [Deltaproteobacteria bacterium]